MGLFTKIKTTVDEQMKNTSDRPKVSLKGLAAGDMLNREWLLRQIPFIIFLVMIALYFINNRFAHEEQLREIDKLKKELIDVKYESLTTSEQLMQMSRQSYVIDRLHEQGSDLQVSVAPTSVIK